MILGAARAKRAATVLALLGALGGLSACGQKGPLYLPQGSSAAPPSAAASPSRTERPGANP